MVCRTGASMTAIGDCVYIYGGQEPSTGLCFGDVVKLDTTCWRWSVLRPAGGHPPPRHAHCAGRLRENCLLVYGGAGQQNVYAAVENAGMQLLAVFGLAPRFSRGAADFACPALTSHARCCHMFMVISYTASEHALTAR
jgi:Kelch motif